MRRLLALLCLCVLVFSAGCLSLGGGSVDEDDLAEDVEHDWNTSANATLTLHKDRYRAVYDLTDQRTIDLYIDRRFQDRKPVDPLGLDFRYPNGTTVNLTGTAVNRSGGATVVTVPDANGSIAFAAHREGKSLHVPVVVDGSHEVVLPPGGRVEYPLLGRVRPRGYGSHYGPDGRVHLTWDAIDSGDRLLVEYYLSRDLLILTGIAGAGALAAIGGTVYFLIKIRRLRRRREEVAIE